MTCVFADRKQIGDGIKCDELSNCSKWENCPHGVIGLDESDGKDCTVRTSACSKDGVIYIMNIEIVEGSPDSLGNQIIRRRTCL